MYCKKTKCLWFFAFALLVTSCATTNNMIKKDSVLSGKDSSVIYGKFIDLPYSESLVSFSFYNRKKDKFYDYTLKTYDDKGSNIIFAYEIPAGKYELFSFTESYGRNINTYYWFNDITEVYSITNYPSDKIFKPLKHTEIEIPANQYVYIGDWSYKPRYNEPIIYTNKNNTDNETSLKFPNITKNSISIIPETKVYNYNLAKLSNNLSIAVIYISNITLIDDERTNFSEISSIYLINKDSKKLYSYSVKYPFTKLCFFNGLPAGKYKIKKLELSKEGSDETVSFTEESIPDGTKILDGSFVLELGSPGNHFVYPNASIDFSINKQGIYFLGSYDFINDSRSTLGYKSKTQVINHPDRISDDINTIKKHLSFENTGWNLSNIIIMTNIFYSTNFTLD